MLKRLFLVFVLIIYSNLNVLAVTYETKDSLWNTRVVDRDTWEVLSTTPSWYNVWDKVDTSDTYWWNTSLYKEWTANTTATNTQSDTNWWWTQSESSWDTSRSSPINTSWTEWWTAWNWWGTWWWKECTSWDICSPDFTIDTWTFSVWWSWLKQWDSKATINNVLSEIIKKLMIVLWIISLFVMTVWAGYMILFHWQDEYLSKWKNIFIWWITSLVIALISYYLVNLVWYILYK